MALVNRTNEGGVAVLELNAPPANTYSYEMMRELDQHVLDARMDPGVHVLVVTGARHGKTEFFCAGADITMLEKADPYFKYDGALVLVRELRHPPEKVWHALTDPAHLREWAPFDADRNLDTSGPVKLSTVEAPTPHVSETSVKRAEAPRLLEGGAPPHVEELRGRDGEGLPGGEGGPAEALRAREVA